MKLLLSLLVMILSLTSLAQAKLIKTTCKDIAGTQLFKTIDITYSSHALNETYKPNSLIDYLVNPEITYQVTYVDNNNTLEYLKEGTDYQGLLDEESMNDGAGRIFYDGIYSEPSGIDYDALRISFYVDDYNYYASAYYYSDGPTIAQFFECSVVE